MAHNRLAGLYVAHGGGAGNNGGPNSRAICDRIFWGSGTHMGFKFIFLLSMTLSDVMNNVATAAVMAPISVSVAQSLGAPPEPFLMAVAVSASCAFLTPIGHKNNLLVMGPDISLAIIGGWVCRWKY